MTASASGTPIPSFDADALITAHARYVDAVLKAGRKVRSSFKALT